MKVLIISSGFTDVSFQILSDGEGVFESPQVMQQHFNTFAVCFKMVWTTNTAVGAYCLDLVKLVCVRARAFLV